MNTNRLAVASSVGALLALAACSDSSTAPGARSLSGASLAADGTAASFNQNNIDHLFVVCKQGTTGVIRVTGSVTTTVTLNDDGITGTADDCDIVSNNSNNTVLTIRAEEVAADNPNVTLNSVAWLRDSDGSNPGAGDIGTTFVQQTYNTAFHGFVAIFNNVAVVTHCTYTKGWYRNKGGDSFNGVDGRTKAQAQAIFDATPGKPGSVTFGGDNSLLNLYQQFLAAILNGGATGPADVAAAISANAGEFGTGFAITTTLTKAEISSLTELLSNFNEGNRDGFPHCE